MTVGEVKKGKVPLLHFLKSERRVKPLEDPRVVSLILRAKNGDEEASEELLEKYIQLIKSIVRHYHTGFVPFEDLLQEGRTSFIDAVRKFDIDRGTRFSTYLTCYVHGYIKRAIKKYRLIKIPDSSWDKYRKVKDSVSELTDILGRQPSIEEISEHSELPHELVQSILQSDVLVFPEILDFGFGDQQQESDDSSLEVNYWLSLVSDKTRRIIELRYGFGTYPHTLEQIANIMKCSREAVRTRINRGIKEIRRHVEET